MVVLAVLGAVVLGLGLTALEAALGRRELRRYVEARGYALEKARWLPFIGLRQVRFKVQLERDGQVIAGSAFVGGHLTGPAFSSRIEFDWDDEPQPGI
jgi:hypothetical protein